MEERYMESHSNREVTIDLKNLWVILRRAWIWMLIALVAAGALTYTVLSVRHVSTYESQASIFVLRHNDRQSSNQSTSSQDVSVATNLINDCMEVVMSERVLDRVIADLQLSLTTDQLRTMIKATNETNSRVLYITVTAEDPKQAMDIANEVSEELCNCFNDYLLNGENQLRAIDRGKLPTKESNPVSLLFVLLIAGLAAVAVYCVFFVIFLLDDKINDEKDVQRYLGLSVLGEIPNKNETRKRRSKDGYYYYYYGAGAYDRAGK